MLNYRVMYGNPAIFEMNGKKNCCTVIFKKGNLSKLSGAAESRYTSQTKYNQFQVN